MVLNGHIGCCNNKTCFYIDHMNGTRATHGATLLSNTACAFLKRNSKTSHRAGFTHFGIVEISTAIYLTKIRTSLEALNSSVATELSYNLALLTFST